MKFLPDLKLYSYRPNDVASICIIFCTYFSLLTH